MKGYQSPAEHARQVALVKRSLSLSKPGGAPAPPGVLRPTCATWRSCG
jgi:hypothetical protein